MKSNDTVSRLRYRSSSPGRPWIHGFLVVAMLLAMSLTGPRTSHAALPEGLYLADATANPGSIYHLESDGSLSTYYTRHSGPLSHFAFSPSDTLFYSDLNTYVIYKYAVATGEIPYFTHTDLIRDLAWGPDGYLYFSTASGSAADGQIWRLREERVGVVAELAYTIPLSSVDGFWRGDFFFDPGGILYLSSGNTELAGLYRLNPADPSSTIRFYQQAEELDGMARDAAGVFYFTTRVGGIYRLEPGLSRHLVWAIPSPSVVWDIAVVGPGPQPSATLFVLPAAAAPGAELRLQGTGFPGSTSLELALVHLAAGMQFDLGMAETEPSGRLRASVLLPAVDEGLYDLIVSQRGGPLATTPIQVLGPLQLDVNPSTAAPGATVDFSVSNLSEGDLQINYAGKAVLGPFPVSPGSYDGRFLVPNDRPLPLGSPTTIQALNLRHGQVIGRAEVPFQSQAAPEPPQYRLTDLQLPPADLAAGDPFTIRGRISPAPGPSLAGFQVVPVWQTVGGQVFPVGSGAPQIDPDGSFEALAHVPSLLKGDPTPPESGAQVGVVLIAPNSQPQSNLQAAPSVWDYFTFKVKVIASDTQQIIPGALVSLVPWENQVQAGSLNAVANTALFMGQDQIQNLLGLPELTPDEELKIKIAKAICAPLPIPVNLDPWEMINPSLEDAMIQAPFQSILQQNTLIQAAPGGAALLTGADELALGAIPPNWVHYLLTVDALDQGYGQVGEDGFPKKFGMHIYYNPQDNTYRNASGAVLPNPYTITLDKLAGGVLSALGPIDLFFSGLLPLESKDPGLLATFGVYYSLNSVPSNVSTPATTSAKVKVVLTTSQYHKLGSQGTKLYLDGQLVAHLQWKFDPGIDCSLFKGVTGTSIPFYEGTATLSNPHLLSTGLHTVRLEATLLGGEVAVYDYGLRVASLPASWFSIAAQGQRFVTWAPAEVKFYNGWLTADGSQQVLTSGAETPETGPLDNSTQANVGFSQSAKASGHKGANVSGSSRGEAVNKSGFGTPFGSLGGSSSQSGGDPALALDTTFSYGPTTEVLVPEVTFTIPEVKYGIPFVAEAGAGGSLSYSASATYAGSVTVKDDGSVHSVVKITPVADINASMYLSGYLLSGALAQAKTTLDALIRLGMPITYNSASNQVDTGQMCFTYSADLTIWGGAVCIPFTDECVFEDSDTENLFNGSKPKGCALPDAAGDSAQAGTSPPFGDLALASNGAGTIMALWQDTTSSLASSLYNGTAWSPAQVIPTGMGSHGPQVSFPAPNQALALWAQTNLTPEIAPSLTVTDAVKAHYLAYALWDGIGWSAPLPLTAPSLGEGGIALAACPSSEPACPEGGAVTAVWERNLSEDLTARQIRLVYATYQAGSWTQPQLVDPASTSTDILPSVAYLNGVPLVAWVRDSDTDLKDVTSRRIALAFLDGGPVSVPGTLPGSIAELALAVDGNGIPLLAFTRAQDSTLLMSNQRPLWFAKGTCAGTSCTWAPQQVSDPYGRSIFAERPILTFDLKNQAILTFRGMGFGPDASGQTAIHAGDSVGMIAGTGDLVKASLNPNSSMVVPTYLTNDGAVNWQPVAAYDPLQDSLVASAVQGTAQGAAQVGLDPNQPPSAAIQTSSPAPGLPLALAITPGLPDFSPASAATSSPYPSAGEPLSVTVQVQNSGTPWPGSADPPLEIVATWDGGAGEGAPAGQASSTSLGDGQFVTITIDLSPPAGGLDEIHVLWLTVNPGLAIAEGDGANNVLTLQLGGLPVPQGLNVVFQPTSGLVFLQWTPVDDARLAGYRIYRSQDGGPLEPVGSTFVPGFVDLNAAVGHTLRYAVSTYTGAGSESAMGSPVEVTLVGGSQVFLPLVVR